MGAHGGRAPQPWSQYEARTAFLRVPASDWAAVKHGSKTEFRIGGPAGNRFAPVAPTPVVAYTVRPGSLYDSKLMVLVKTWKEPLAAISDESLAREGFPDMAHFRRYWMGRTHRRFQPLTSVQVYQVRAWEPSDVEELGATLLRRLYRDHL